MKFRNQFFLFLIGLMGLSPDLWAQTYTWKNVTVPAGGYVSGVEFSPVQSGLYYARTDMGGAYRWDGTNNVWVPMTDFLLNWNLYGIESLAPDPKNANTVYAAIGQTYSGGNGYILASTNQGASWTQYSIGCPIGGNNDGRNAGERLAVDPNLTSILYFGSRSNGLWKSTNSAATWAQVGAFPTTGAAGYGLSWVIFDPHGTNGTASATIYVGVANLGSGNSNLYRSTNAGASWAVVPGGPVNMTTPHASLGTDGMLWLNYGSGGYGPNGITTGQVWKLNTATLGWTNVTPSNGPAAGAGGFGGISVDAQNAQHVVISTLDWWGGTDKDFQTTNGGTSWTVIGNSQNSWNGGPYAQYNNNGAIWTRFCGTYDGGVGWQGDIRIDPFNSAHVLYTTGGGVWDSSNINAATQPAGVTWTFKDYGLEETAITDMTTSVAGGVLFSAIGDITGMRHTNLTQSPALGMYCNPSMSTTDGIDFAELNTNFVVREGHSLSVATQAGGYSTNNGQSWTAFASNPAGFSTGNGNGQISVNADGTVILWALPGSSPAYSTNNGSSWTNTSGLPNGAQICSDRANKTIFYGVSGTNLYVSTNSGASFSVAGTFAGNLSWANRPRAVFGIAGEVWLTTSSGLYRFTNVGLGGVTTTQIPNISSGVAVGFGMHATGQTHPAVYFIGTVSGQYGFYRCDDGIGTTWVRINDNNHQYGGGEFAMGDETVYGRMYVGTNGRGILYGDVASGSTPTFTFTSTKTNTPTITFTNTLTLTLTATKTNTTTNTSTPTNTPTLTSTPTNTSTNTTIPTATSTYTRTATSTNTATGTPTSTNTATSTNSFTRTSTNTATNTFIPTSSSTSTSTLTNTATATNSRTFTPTMTNSPTTTGTSTLTSTSIPTNTATSTSTYTNSSTPTNTSTFTRTSTSTSASTPTVTSTSTNSPTGTTPPTNTFTVTSTFTNTATKTFTGTNTFTNTPTSTPTATSTNMSTATRSATYTNTSTATPLGTATRTATSTNTSTGTPTFTNSRTPTSSATNTATSTNTFTNTPTNTGTPTNSFTGTASPTATFTSTGTSTNTSTSTSTSTRTPTGTPTFTSSPTPTMSATMTNISTKTFTNTSTNTNSLTETNTSTNTFTGTSTPTATSTSTNTATGTLSPTPTFTGTSTHTPTSTNSFTSTSTYSSTPTSSATPTMSATFSNTPTATYTSTPTSTNSFTRTNTATSTSTSTPTVSNTFTATSTGTLSPTPTFTFTNTRTSTAMATASFTPTSTSTSTSSFSPTFTATSTPSFTNTFSLTSTPTGTPSFTHTATGTVTTTPKASTVPVIYPNPASGGNVNILPPPYSGQQNVKVEIFTSAFRQVQDTTFFNVPSGVAVTVELTDRWGRPLANGLYYVVVVVNGKHSIAKLLILR